MGLQKTFTAMLLAESLEDYKDSIWNESETDMLVPLVYLSKITASQVRHKLRFSRDHINPQRHDLTRNLINSCSKHLAFDTGFFVIKSL